MCGVGVGSPQSLGVNKIRNARDAVGPRGGPAPRPRRRKKTRRIFIRTLMHSTRLLADASAGCPDLWGYTTPRHLQRPAADTASEAEASARFARGARVEPTSEVNRHRHRRRDIRTAANWTSSGHRRKATTSPRDQSEICTTTSFHGSTLHERQWHRRRLLQQARGSQNPTTPGIAEASILRPLNALHQHGLSCEPRSRFPVGATCLIAAYRETTSRGNASSDEPLLLPTLRASWRWASPWAGALSLCARRPHENTVPDRQRAMCKPTRTVRLAPSPTRVPPHATSAQPQTQPAPGAYGGPLVAMGAHESNKHTPLLLRVDVELLFLLQVSCGIYPPTRSSQTMLEHTHLHSLPGPPVGKRPRRARRQRQGSVWRCIQAAPSAPAGSCGCGGRRHRSPPRGTRCTRGALGSGMLRKGRAVVVVEQISC